jgi:hypothetical protein
MPADDDDDDGDGGGGGTTNTPGMQAAQFIAHTPVITFDDVKQRDILLKTLLKNMREKQRRSMCALDKTHFARICDGSQLYQELVEEYYPEFAGWENKRAIVGGVPPYDDTDGSWAVYFRGLHKSVHIREACTVFLTGVARNDLSMQTIASHDPIYSARCASYFTELKAIERRYALVDEFLATPAAAAAASNVVDQMTKFAVGDTRRYKWDRFPWREFFFFLIDQLDAAAPDAAGVAANGRLLPIDEEFRVRIEHILNLSDEMRYQDVLRDLLRVKRRCFGDGPFTWVTCALTLSKETLRREISILSDDNTLRILQNVSIVTPLVLTAEAYHRFRWLTAPGRPAVDLELALQPGGYYSHIGAPERLISQTRPYEAGEPVSFRAGTSQRNKWRFFAFTKAIESEQRGALDVTLAGYVADWLVDRTWFQNYAVRFASPAMIEYLIQLDTLIATDALPDNVGADLYSNWWFEKSRDVARDHLIWWHTKARALAQSANKPAVIQLLEREFPSQPTTTKTTKVTESASMAED